MRRLVRSFLVILIPVIAAIPAWSKEPAAIRSNASDREAAAEFENRVRPLLAERCLECHGPRKQESNLRLDSREAMMQGGDSGPAIRPGRPGEILLIKAL